MNPTTNTVDIIPYFSNLAAIAILAAQPADAPRIKKWIQWYADHQETDGTIYDFQGTVNHYTKSQTRDSTDSYAATYLMVLWRYTKATTIEDAKPLAPSAIKALAAIALTQDPADGLTWAKPEYHAKYLMDNLEVCCGLDEAAKYFDSIKDNQHANKTRAMRQSCINGLKTFWLEKNGYYAWAKNTDGTFNSSLKIWYPDGMVNLFAASITLPAKSALWQNLQKTFSKNPQATPDWWMRAALQLGTPQQIEQYRTQTENQAAEMPANTPLDRAAWVTLALRWQAAEFTKVDLTFDK